MNIKKCSKPPPRKSMRKKLIISSKSLLSLLSSYQFLCILCVFERLMIFLNIQRSSFHQIFLKSLKHKNTQIFPNLPPPPNNPRDHHLVDATPPPFLYIFVKATPLQPVKFLVGTKTMGGHPTNKPSTFHRAGARCCLTLGSNDPS